MYTLIVVGEVFPMFRSTHVEKHNNSLNRMDVARLGVDVDMVEGDFVHPVIFGVSSRRVLKRGS